MVCPGPLKHPPGTHPKLWKVFKGPDVSELLRPAALRAPVFGPGELSGLKGLAAVWTDGKDIHVEANKSQVQSREVRRAGGSGR